MFLPAPLRRTVLTLRLLGLLGLTVIVAAACNRDAADAAANTVDTVAQAPGPQTVLDSLDGELDATDEAAALPPVPLNTLPDDVQRLLAALAAAPQRGTTALQPFVDPQYSVQYLHPGTDDVPNLDVLTADEVLGVRALGKFVEAYRPAATEHFRAPAGFTGCDLNRPGVYLSDLAEPLATLTVAYQLKQEALGAETNPRRVAALKAIEESTRQLLTLYVTDAQANTHYLRLYLRRSGGKLYLAAIDTQDCGGA